MCLLRDSGHRKILIIFLRKMIPLSNKLEKGVYKIPYWTIKSHVSTEGSYRRDICLTLPSHPYLISKVPFSYNVLQFLADQALSDFQTSSFDDREKGDN